MSMTEGHAKKERRRIRSDQTARVLREMADGRFVVIVLRQNKFRNDGRVAAESLAVNDSNEEGGAEGHDGHIYIAIGISPL